MLTRSVSHLVFGKDDVSCLDMPTRHTRTSRGTEAPALLRCRGRDGKRLARGTEAACLAAGAQPANSRSRRRNRIFITRTHGQVSPVNRCRPGVPRQCARVITKRGRSRHESARRCKRRAYRTPGRLLSGEHRRNFAENLTGISAVAAGAGVAVGGDVLRHILGNRVELLHIATGPKPVAVGIVGTKGRLSPVAEKFWQCAKEAAGAAG